MKIRDSGMPEHDMWAKFFDAKKILVALGFNNKVNDAAEFGCGYGTFTIPAAKMISGKIYALDIEPDMIRMTGEEAKKHKLDNVETTLRDFMAEGSGLPDESVDYVMLFNILHLENPKALLKEAGRILRKDGKMGAIHWNYDPTTPRGPSMDIRPKPEQIIEWAESVGFKFASQHDLKPYHYGLVFEKAKSINKGAA
ncbi:MAG: class I SAM-dependent methyltransferase [Candidatus Omnitrophica bacterium]|nr:class I SAM-dependent methyltransferase [Candidatus Omnitrophota bacterium]